MPLRRWLPKDDAKDHQPPFGKSKLPTSFAVVVMDAISSFEVFAASINPRKISHTICMWPACCLVDSAFGSCIMGAL